MLWNYCVVLCIYEHGHDNVVRRLCGNIDHGIVGEPVDTIHTIYAGVILYPRRGAPKENVHCAQEPVFWRASSLHPGSFYFAIYLEKFVRTLGSAIIYSWSQV